MKKNSYKKGTVHPNPPLITDHLSFLPATVLTLTSLLSQEDKEVLAYLLLTCSSGNFSGNPKTTKKSTTTTTTSGGAYNHPPSFNCDCFNCYLSNYLLTCSPGNFSGNPRNTKKSTTSTGGAYHPPSFNCYCFNCYMSYWVRWDLSPNRELVHEIIDAFEDGLLQSTTTNKQSKKERRINNKKKLGSGVDFNELKKSSELNRNESDSVADNSGSRGHGGGGGEEEGSVRKFVSFLGERIWSALT